MTEEELFKVYIKRELCAHCRFPQLCKGEEVRKDVVIREDDGEWREPLIEVTDD